MTSTSTTPQFRTAEPYDLPKIASLFHAMLKELAPLGHDILPTERNMVTFIDQVFAPALANDKHGLVMAEAGELVVGASFFTPDNSGLDLLGRRAIAHGIFVVPAWRGFGIAKRLQALAHARLADLGFTHLTSVVVKDNKAGLASAQGSGAVVTGYYTSVNLQPD